MATARSGNQSVTSEREFKVIDYLKQPTILTNQIVLTVNWVALVFSYHMLPLQTKHFPGDYNANMLTLQVFNLIAPLVAFFVLMKLFTTKQNFITIFGVLTVAFLLTQCFAVDE